jgi:HEAT repeat protein
MNTPNQIPIQKLLDALLDESTYFHPRYLYRLSDMDPDDLARLIKVWNQVPLWRRQALMEDLQELSENDTLLYLEGMGRIALKDSDPKVRMLAVRILGEYEDRELIPVYLKMVESDSDANVRAMSATALGAFVYLGEIDELPKKKFRQVENTLLRVVKGSDDPLVRRRALEALGFSSRTEVIPLIEEACNSKKSDWMVSSLFAMGRSANEYWNNRVLTMLSHSLPDIQAEAASAAGELGIKEAVPNLFELLDDSDIDVRMAAIWSLSQIGGEGVGEALEERLDQAEDEDEADFIESALDNLAFTEDMGLFSMIGLAKDTRLDVPEYDKHPSNGENLEDDTDTEDTQV